MVPEDTMGTDAEDRTTLLTSEPTPGEFVHDLPTTNDERPQSEHFEHRLITVTIRAADHMIIGTADTTKQFHDCGAPHGIPGRVKTVSHSPLVFLHRTWSFSPSHRCHSVRPSGIHTAYHWSCAGIGMLDQRTASYSILSASIGTGPNGVGFAARGGRTANAKGAMMIDNSETKNPRRFIEPPQS